jgi:hypothetical protein
LCLFSSFTYMFALFYIALKKNRERERERILSYI